MAVELGPGAWAWFWEWESSLTPEEVEYSVVPALGATRSSSVRFILSLGGVNKARINSV